MSENDRASLLRAMWTEAAPSARAYAIETLLVEAAIMRRSAAQAEYGNDEKTEAVAAIQPANELMRGAHQASLETATALASVSPDLDLAALLTLAAELLKETR